MGSPSPTPQLSPSNSHTSYNDDQISNNHAFPNNISDDDEQHSESSTLLNTTQESFGFRQIPIPVYLVIIVEAMERFSFYGLVSMLVLFLRNELLFEESSAKSLFSAFTSLCYFVPLLGSFLGDAVLGRFWTISGAAFLYIIGVTLLVYTTWQKHRATVFIALFLIALATGCLKPNIAAFGAQSLRTTDPKAISKYFSMFYFSINCGGLVSTLILPIVQDNASYTVAYTIPACCLFVALVVFMSGKRWYVHQPPSQSLYVRLIKVICAARREKEFLAHQHQHQHQPVILPVLRHTRSHRRRPALSGNGQDEHDVVQMAKCADTSLSSDYHQHDQQPHPDSISSNNPTPSPLPPDLAYEPHWLDYAKLRYKPEHVEEIKSVLNVFPIFPFVIFFWLCFDQQYSTFVLQAEKMDRMIFRGHFEVLAPQISALNSICILLFVPIFDSILYPTLRHCGFQLKHLNRMLFGMILTLLAFLSCSFVDYQIETHEPNTVTIWLQLPQYIIITAAEILISMTGLEFIYSQAPIPFRSTLAGFWGLTVAFGDMLAAILFSTVKIKAWQFSLLCAGLMLVDFFAFLPVSIWFNNKTQKALDAEIDQQLQFVDSPDYGTSSDDYFNPQSLESTRPQQQEEFEHYDASTPFEPISDDHRDALLHGSLYN